MITSFHNLTWRFIIIFQVDVGNSSFVHLRVYQTLPHAGSTIELTDIKTGLKEDDNLDYF